MKELITSFALVAAQIKERANSALKPLGPVDQFLGSGEVAYVLSTMKYAETELTRMVENAESVLAKYDSELAAAAKPLIDAGIAAALASGDLMKKEDHELAVVAAKAAVKNDVEAAFALEKKSTEQITARRLEVVTAHGESVAASLPEDVLKVEDFAPVAAELSRRVDLLSQINVTPESAPTAFASIACKIGFDDAGKAEFESRYAAAKEIAPLKTPAQIAASHQQQQRVPGSGPVPAAPKVGGPAPEPAEKPAVTAYGF